MQPEVGDTNPRNGYDKTAASHCRPIISVGPRRAAPGRGKAAITDVRIARIETVVMTAEEYADAVESLAVLIARYERTHAKQPTEAA
jgi:hypothetical protein